MQDLYKWRDTIARESDESSEYVLKSHQLLKIAELLPREIYGILALCNPISNIVETNVHEIHDIVKTARDFRDTLSLSSINRDDNETSRNGINTENNKEQLSNNLLNSIVQSVKYDPDSILNCPHDFPHTNEHESEMMESDANQRHLMDGSHVEDAIRSDLADLLIKPRQTTQPDIHQHLSEIFQVYYIIFKIQKS